MPLVVKSVTFSEEPKWWKYQTFAAVPGKFEMSLADGVVSIRIIGDAPECARLRSRLGGDEIFLSRYDYVVCEHVTADDPKKPEKPKP